MQLFWQLAIHRNHCRLTSTPNEELFPKRSVLDHCTAREVIPFLCPLWELLVMNTGYQVGLMDRVVLTRAVKGVPMRGPGVLSASSSLLQYGTALPCHAWRGAAASRPLWLDEPRAEAVVTCNSQYQEGMMSFCGQSNQSSRGISCKVKRLRSLQPP